MLPDKYRIVTKDNKYSIQRKTFFGNWVLYKYDYVDGYCIISENSPEEAVSVFNKVQNQTSFDQGWEVV